VKEGGELIVLNSMVFKGNGQFLAEPIQLHLIPTKALEPQGLRLRKRGAAALISNDMVRRSPPDMTLTTDPRKLLVATPNH
jgi:hypothetical protein